MKNMAAFDETEKSMIREASNRLADLFEKHDVPATGLNGVACIYIGVRHMVGWHLANLAEPASLENSIKEIVALAMKDELDLNDGTKRSEDSVEG